MAITTRISTGSTVQATSSSVWWVGPRRDRIGLLVESHHAHRSAARARRGDDRDDRQQNAVVEGVDFVGDRRVRQLHADLPGIGKAVARRLRGERGPAGEAGRAVPSARAFPSAEAPGRTKEALRRSARLKSGTARACRAAKSHLRIINFHCRKRDRSIGAGPACFDGFDRSHQRNTKFDADQYALHPSAQALGPQELAAQRSASRA